MPEKSWGFYADISNRVDGIIFSVFFRGIFLQSRKLPGKFWQARGFVNKKHVIFEKGV